MSKKTFYRSNTLMKTRMHSSSVTTKKPRFSLSSMYDAKINSLSAQIHKNQGEISKDSALFDVMCSSQGMRKNPLGMIITTAGFNKFGFCYEYRQTCLDILHGLKENDSQFAAIFATSSKTTAL